MNLKLRASYILLAISLVILAIGITLIVNHSAPDKTTLVNRTVVVPTGEDYRFFFDIPKTGVLKVTVEVESGGIIFFDLYKDSERWPPGEGRWTDTRSSFEVPIDAGSYYLNLSDDNPGPGPIFPSWGQQGGSEARTVRVYLEFEG